jgi:hypothetical protein
MKLIKNPYFFFLIFFIFSLLKYKCIFISNSNSSNDLVFKFDNLFYNKLEKEGEVEKYKNSVIKKLKMRYIDGNKKENINETLLNLNLNYTYSNKNRLKNERNYRKRNLTSNLYRDSFSHPNLIEIFAKERTIRFYISLINDCNILINDTINYEKSKTNVEFIEHYILNNNAEFIDPKAVFTNIINLNLFVFNKKDNLFTVLLDKKNNDKTNLTVEYNYLAGNILKSQKNKINNLHNNNTFLWKFFNENSSKKLKLNIEIYFTIDKLFENDTVTFIANGDNSTLNFNKSIISNSNQRVVKYEWKGELIPNEIIVLETKFPLIIESCKSVMIDIPMILVGSIFIFFLIFVLYIILSQIMKLEE